MVASLRAASASSSSAKSRSLLAAAPEALVLEQANELLEQLDVPCVLFELYLLLEHQLLKGFDVVGKIERSIYHECMLTQTWNSRIREQSDKRDFHAV
jgi:hypothetical protein